MLTNSSPAADPERCPNCGCYVTRPSRFGCKAAPHPAPGPGLRAAFAVRRELADRRLGWACLEGDLQEEIEDALALAILGAMRGGTTEPAPPPPASVEQMCRELLDRAVAEGVVTFNAANFVSTAEPQQMTAGDLAGLANLLQSYLAAATRARDERWEKAVGCSLETAEENAAEVERYRSARGAPADG